MTKSAKKLATDIHRILSSLLATMLKILHITYTQIESCIQIHRIECADKTCFCRLGHILMQFWFLKQATSKQWHYKPTGSVHYLNSVTITEYFITKEIHCNCTTVWPDHCHISVFFSNAVRLLMAYYSYTKLQKNSVIICDCIWENLTFSHILQTRRKEHVTKPYWREFKFL